LPAIVCVKEQLYIEKNDSNSGLHRGIRCVNIVHDLMVVPGSNEGCISEDARSEIGLTR
jgi:hypothetical protein